jgi:hypothetical protein
VNFQLAVVIDEPQLTKFIHEGAHARARRADNIGERLLADFGYHRLRFAGLPAIRGTKATSDMSYLDKLYRERAERGGIVYVDIWDGFVDEDGDYAVQGPDFEGQIRRLRTADGVYFTKAGAVKIASYVDRELRRVMPSYVAPVALPGPEATPKSGPASARPDVGPVLPLTASGGDHGGELLGASPPTRSDPVAAKVLSRGETLAAPAGRADDFSWPRPGNDASANPDFSREPVAVAPDTLGTAKGDGKNQADAKKDAKEKSASDSRVSARVSPHRYYNYYAGRHYGRTEDIITAGTTAGNHRRVLSMTTAAAQSIRSGYNLKTRCLSHPASLVRA